MRLFPVLLLRLALLIAIFASAALIVDYANAGDPAFCGVTSGCFTVRRSGYAYLFGYLPMPAVGLACFASLFGFAFVARNRVMAASVAGMASIGAVAAMYLLYLQHSVIGAMCPWCVTVDTSAIVAAIAAIWVWSNGRKDEASVRLPDAPYVSLAWVLAAVVGIGAPFLWGKFPAKPPVPEAIKSEHIADKLTLVTFTDFECPFCRRLHPVLHKIVEEHSDRMHLVRKMVPLPIHPGSEPAALAYLCSPAALQDAVADKLYAATPEQLTPEGAVIVAAMAGADAGELSTCIKSPATLAKLEAEKKLFEELGGPGLPFTFVGKRVVVGANADGLKSAVEAELSGEHLSLPVWAMFALVGAAFVAAMGVTVAGQTRDKRAA